MKKKEYVRPETLVFDMDIKTNILAGSPNLTEGNYGNLDGDQETD